MQAQTVMNETQDISLNGDQLSITNGSTITLPSGGTDQALTIVGHDLTISGGNTITIPDRYIDGDADSQNEIQDLDLSHNVLTITGNTSATDISLTPYLDNTDDQTLSEILGVSTSAGDSKISSLANPTDDQDAATKIYVDDAVSDEAVRATAAEGVLTTAISDETDNRLSADETLQTAIDGKSDNGHDHNSAYYQKLESDANYLSINGGTLNGDLDVVGDVTAKNGDFDEYLYVNGALGVNGSFSAIHGDLETLLISDEIVVIGDITAEDGHFLSFLHADAGISTDGQVYGEFGYINTDLQVNEDIVAFGAITGNTISGDGHGLTNLDLSNVPDPTANQDAANKVYVDAETTRATAVEGVNADAIAAEVTRAGLAETANTNAITVERGRTDNILSGSDADKDSFAEIVSLINTVDTENDNALAAEITRATTAEGVNATAIASHSGLANNPHSVTKTQVGLGNVDNTSDATKNTAVATLSNKTLTSPKVNEDVVLSATATELNKLDGATASTTELNYVTGVTSAIQTQLTANAGAVTTHAARTDNPHSVTKTQVGLGNVDNTSDATKNTAVATLSNKTLTSPKVNEDVVLSATATELNKLDGATTSTTELNYVTGVTSAIQTQLTANAGAVSTHAARTDNPHSVTKTQVGLGNVDNTSDATKNTAVATLSNKTLTSPKVNEDVVLSATATELNKLDGATASTTELNYVTGVTSAIQTQLTANAGAVSTHTARTDNPHSVTKTQVGLSNVDNTSDASKPVSTATQTALNLKANIASPALTGTPTAPTQATSDNSTKIATTAYVTSKVSAASAITKYSSGTGPAATFPSLSVGQSVKVNIRYSTGINGCVIRLNNSTSSPYYADVANYYPLGTGAPMTGYSTNGSTNGFYIVPNGPTTNADMDFTITKTQFGTVIEGWLLNDNGGTQKSFLKMHGVWHSGAAPNSISIWNGTAYVTLTYDVYYMP